MESTFSGTHWPSVCLLWEIVCSDLLPKFWSGNLVFCHWVVWVLCIVWLLALHEIHDLQIIFPSFCRLPFHCIVLFALQNLFWCSATFFFVFVFFLLLISDLKSRCQEWYEGATAYEHRGFVINPNTSRLWKSRM